MAVGEHITVCDGDMNEYECELVAFSGDVEARIINKKRTASEPPFFACIWQALPKGEKLDTVIQKSVECGASEIRLFESERCIVRTNPASEDKKGQRRQKIALEAAKQSGRGIVPRVFGAVSFSGTSVTFSIFDASPFETTVEKPWLTPFTVFSFPPVTFIPSNSSGSSVYTE